MQQSAVFQLDPPTRRRVEQIASSRHQSEDSIVREAVQQYLEREDKRQQLLADTAAVWETFQRSGLHATAEEVDLWLARLEAGEDASPPTCHV